MIAFRLHDRHIRFVLPLPDRQDRSFTHTPTGLQRTERSGADAYEQVVRQRWRALALVIKAKLEAIESRISTVDEEFLAHIVLPDGRTYGDFSVPQIDEVYRTGAMPPLLPGAASPLLLVEARTVS